MAGHRAGARMVRETGARTLCCRGPGRAAGRTAVGVDALPWLAPAGSPAHLGGDPGRAARPDDHRVPAGLPGLPDLARLGLLHPRRRPLRGRDHPRRADAGAVGDRADAPGRGRARRSGPDLDPRSTSRPVRDLVRHWSCHERGGGHSSSTGHTVRLDSIGRSAADHPRRAAPPRGVHAFSRADQPREVRRGAPVHPGDRGARLAVADVRTHPRRRPPLAGNLRAQPRQTPT